MAFILLYGGRQGANKLYLIRKCRSCKWECDGSPEYKLNKSDKSERGRNILHISEDALDYLEDHKLNELLHKYCQFLPTPIRFGTKEESVEEAKKKTVPNIINNPSPAWVKKPADLKDEDYIAFYKELSICRRSFVLDSLNVDHLLILGILYFPKLSNNFELQKEKIELYCERVFVTDAVEILFLTF